jgi:hypothetical protein
MSAPFLVKDIYPGSNSSLDGSSDSMVISFSNQKSRLANAYGNFRSLQTRKLVA